ncbi:isocitrate lyase/PEP mutase family protein [Paraburkholderia guartelaensis]|uniref:isocitrate lyase/PEP mutase family protein n=1 Tax=Paraburkholderia guartelaensis TaxID=2546446 RepID=UPI002AB6CF76|nr:isocitrate lyase/PEP mutase family protein [Paraburkholderia guartelaensis]
MKKQSIRSLLSEATHGIVMPCVYDAASARAVELVGFESMMFSSGEFSCAANGLFEYGFNNVSDVEWMVNRITQTSPLPLAVDIEDGYGGPLAVYRACKRMVRAGATAIQLEDGGHPENPLELLPRDEYLAKVKAAVEALEGTDCLLIARTNADPKTQLDEAVRRCVAANEIGAECTTVVRLSNLEDARYVGERVPGWKMYPDASAKNGVVDVTVDQVYELGFNFMTIHYLLKAAMDGMIEHGLKNFQQKNCLYTNDKVDATGIMGESATPLFDPNAFMAFEARFTGVQKNYRIGDHEMPPFPEQFVRTPVKQRF